MTGIYNPVYHGPLPGDSLLFLAQYQIFQMRYTTNPLFGISHQRIAIFKATVLWLAMFRVSEVSIPIVKVETTKVKTKQNKGIKCTRVGLLQ